MERARFNDITANQNHLRRRELNQLQDAVESLTRPVGGGGVAPTFGSRGISFIDQNSKGFWAALTGRQGRAYSWKKQFENPDDGTLTDDADDGGGTFTQWPAYEATGRTDLATDGSVKVFLRLGRGEYYTFREGGNAVGSSTFLKSTVALGSGSIPQNRVTPITWGGGGNQFFFNTLFPTRFTIPASQPQNGIYQVHAFIFIINPDIVADFSGRFYTNGSRVNPEHYDVSGSCSGVSMKLEHQENLTLNPNDYVEYGIFHSQAGINRTATGGQFSILYLGI